jgi:hypothetical protein
LFTVFGNDWASRAIVKLPLVVRTSAVYRRAGSMHTGGGLANCVVR